MSRSARSAGVLLLCCALHLASPTTRTAVASRLRFSRSASGPSPRIFASLSPAELEETANALNSARELDELIVAVARAFSPMGEAERRANVWSRGTYVLESARVRAVHPTGLVLVARITERDKTRDEESPLLEWQSRASCETKDELQRELLLLANAVGRPRDGAVLLGLAIGSQGWRLPDDWRLNAIPHPAAVRHKFYDDAYAALRTALSSADCPSRLRLTLLPPELNQAMDVYRGATLLELVRELSLKLASDADAGGRGRPLNVRVCVQAAMGAGVFQGLPLAISGLRKTMELMDWQSAPGERFAGILGQPGPGPPGRLFEGAGDDDSSADGDGSSAAASPQASLGRVRFGAVEGAEARPGDDVLLVLAPQSMQGICIVGPLQRLTEAAEAVGATVVLVNPALGDIPSAAGVMQVKGRGGRIEFSRSFYDVLVFRCLYFAGRFVFPIVGALRFSVADAPFWVVSRRLEGEQCAAHAAGVTEEYAPVAVFAEALEPSAGAAPRTGAESAAPLRWARAPTDEAITEVLDPKMNRRGRVGGAAGV